MIEPMPVGYLDELKQLHDNGIRHARQCWNLECEPNWKRVMAGSAAFHNALRAEWDRLSGNGRRKAGQNVYGTPFQVDVETGVAQGN